MTTGYGKERRVAGQTFFLPRKFSKITLSNGRSQALASREFGLRLHEAVTITGGQPTIRFFLMTVGASRGLRTFTGQNFLNRCVRSLS